jgi:shikimate dehydrogenase
MTKYAGLIGYPVGHSISPAMQQAAFDHYKLDIRYELWETEPSELGAVVERLRRPETLGANVTVPHKETVMPSMDELDDLALEIGAVNTIVNRGSRLVGYNTDAGGFLRALRKEGGFDPAGKRAVLVGAGGVARAAGFALARAGVKSLVITDIISERAHGLASDLERSLARTQGPPPRSCVDAKEIGGVASLDFQMHPIPEIKVLSPDEPQFAETILGCDLLVNCTPVGMKHSATEGESPVEAKLVPKGALVYDVVYNPLETPLLTDTKKAGGRTLSGLAMLVYQGAMAFEMWTGKEAPVDIMLNAAKKALSE